LIESKREISSLSRSIRAMEAFPTHNSHLLPALTSPRYEIKEDMNGELEYLHYNKPTLIKMIEEQLRKDKRKYRKDHNLPSFVNSDVATETTSTTPLHTSTKTTPVPQNHKKSSNESTETKTQQLSSPNHTRSSSSSSLTEEYPIKIEDDTPTTTTETEKSQQATRIQGKSGHSEGDFGFGHKKKRRDPFKIEGGGVDRREEEVVEKGQTEKIAEEELRKGQSDEEKDEDLGKDGEKKQSEINDSNQQVEGGEGVKEETKPIVPRLNLSRGSQGSATSGRQVHKPETSRQDDSDNGYVPSFNTARERRYRPSDSRTSTVASTTGKAKQSETRPKAIFLEDSGSCDDLDFAFSRRAGKKAHQTTKENTETTEYVPSMNAQ